MKNRTVEHRAGWLYACELLWLVFAHCVSSFEQGPCSSQETFRSVRIIWICVRHDKVPQGNHLMFCGEEQGLIYRYLYRVQRPCRWEIAFNSNSIKNPPSYIHTYILILATYWNVCTKNDQSAHNAATIFAQDSNCSLHSPTKITYFT